MNIAKLVAYLPESVKRDIMDFQYVSHNSKGMTRVLLDRLLTE